MKKILKISALSLMLVLASGCGGGSDGKPNHGNPTKPGKGGGDDNNKKEVEDISLATSYMVNESTKVVTSLKPFGFRSKAYTFNSLDINGSIGSMVLSNDLKKAYITGDFYMGDNEYHQVHRYGINIIDLLNIKLLGHLQLQYPMEYSTKLSISNLNKTAYLSTEFGNSVIDINNSLNPILVGQIGPFNITNSILLSHDNTKAYVSYYHGGIDVLDIINGETLSHIDTQKSMNTAIKLSKDSSTLYVGRQGKGIEVIDVSDDKNPKVLDYIQTDSNVLDIVFSKDNTKLYVAEGENGIEIIDLNYNMVRDVNASEAISAFDTDGYAKSIALSPDGKKAYIADGSEGIKILDITDLTKLKKITNLHNLKDPLLLSSFYTSGSVNSITLSKDGSRAYTSSNILKDYKAKVEIIDLTSNIVERLKNFRNNNINFIFEKSLGKVEISITADRNDIVNIGKYITTFNPNKNSNIYSIPISSIAGATGLTILTIKIKKGDKIGTRKVYLKVKESVVTGHHKN